MELPGVRSQLELPGVRSQLELPGVRSQFELLEEETSSETLPVDAHTSELNPTCIATTAVMLRTLALMRRAIRGYDMI